MDDEPTDEDLNQVENEPLTPEDENLQGQLGEDDEGDETEDDDAETDDSEIDEAL